MDLTLTEEIRQAFCQDGRQPLVSIDAEDIEAMIGNGEDVRLVTLTGDSVAALVEQLRATPQLHSARQIILELIIATGYEFPFSDLVPLSDYLVSLPNKPEIRWGYYRSDNQSPNLKLNILLPLNTHEN